MSSSNQRLFADKLRFLTGLTSSPVADSNLQEFVDAFTLPSTDGDSDQVLKTDGEGLITFGSASSGGGGVDSATVLGLIDSAHVQLRQDYSTVLGLIDSAHVQLRQDYAYASLTGSPNVLDSADVSLIAGSAGLDSALSIQLIDAKIQVLDIADIVGSSGNSGQYLKSLGSGDAEWANVLDSAGVATIAGGLSGLDSGGVSALVDSDYVQLRQDFAYGSLTGTPNVLDSADVSLIAGSSAGVDSATVLSLIDSAHVQLSAIGLPYSSLTATPTILDSADVSAIAGSSAGGVDSATVLGLIDSAHIQSKITSSTIYTRTITTATAGQTVFAATYTPNYVDVFVNGTAIFQTMNSSFSVDVLQGDLIQVKTSIDCEGVFAKEIDLFESITAYPNPTKGIFEIGLPFAKKEVIIELYNMQSQLISSKTYAVNYGKAQLNIEELPRGLYLVKVKLNKLESSLLKVVIILSI